MFINDFVQAWNAAYRRKDLDAALTIALPAMLQLQHDLYQPYWLKHIWIVGEKHYNDLIDAFWISREDTCGSGYWVNERFSTVCLPPTCELCERQFSVSLEEALATA